MSIQVYEHPKRGFACDPKTGEERIEALRWILAEHQCLYIDGQYVDVVSANVAITIYDALEAKNQAKMRGFDIPKMVRVSWAVLDNQKKAS